MEAAGRSGRGVEKGLTFGPCAGRPFPTATPAFNRLAARRGDLQANGFVDGMVDGKAGPRVD